MDEFAFIAKLLAPLSAREEGALGLQDDAAVLKIPRAQELVVTKDAITEGVHFMGNESPDLIARKLLRVNLSDLAAMGAQPWGYFLALMLPPETDEKWLSRFAAGLRKDQKEFGLTLMGGDTTQTKGALALTVTALGLVPAGKALKRNGAKAGDEIYVSGTIGDGALGLGEARKTQAADPHLLKRYQLPEPRLALGMALRGIATGCMDISDGLAQDLGHICAASGVGAHIRFHDIPLSMSASRMLKSKNIREIILAGGDDYELLFTAPASARQKLQAAAKAAKTSITRIGNITQDGKVQVLDEKGKAIKLARTGWRHF